MAYAECVKVMPLAEACDLKLIDLAALYEWMDWRLPAVQERRRAAELCEVLVPDYVKLDFIRNLPGD